MMRVLLAAVAALFVLWAWAGDTPKIGQEALLEKMASGDGDLVILDVRTAKEYEDGHVPGAVNIPHEELGSRLPEIEAGREADIVVYCRSGRRSEIALDLLAGAGFERLHHLEGDYLAWSAAGRPVEKPSQAAPAQAEAPVAPPAP